MHVPIGRLWLLPAAAVLLCVAAAGAVRAACLVGMVDAAPRPIPAAWRAAEAVPAGHVRIAFLGHSSFVIETPGGVRAVTDFNGAIAPGFVPDIVTMNNAHGSHFTDYPDPRIRFVLRGWRPGGGMARHDVRYRDMRVFNVATNIGEYGDPGSNGNSIFVFEIAGLCIAHVGHLHHVPTREQIARLGRIDVLFVPIDGSMTMTHAQALETIGLISPRLVIPMHFGFFGAADAFFERARERYVIESDKGSVLLVRRETLPKSTEIRFLQGRQF